MRLVRAILLGCATLALAALSSVPEADAAQNPRGAVAAKKAAKPLKITPAKRQAAPARTVRRKAAAAPRAAKARPAVRQPLSRAAHSFGSLPGAREVLPLTPAQRAVIYRSIVEAPLAPNPVIVGRARRPVEPSPEARMPPPAPSPGPEPPAAELAVGAAVPPTVPLHPMPQQAIAAVPQVEAYRYVFVGDRVLLVDPITGIVIAAINQ